MAINNPVISYENVAVLRNITGADVSFSNSGNYLEFITKVQDFSYSFNIENQILDLIIENIKTLPKEQ